MPESEKNIPKRLISDGDLIPDGRLVNSKDDLLAHESIASTLAELALKATTPVNIALFGSWGAGKSSMCGMIAERVAKLDSKTKVVRYDAWKYGGQDLKRNFIQSLAHELGLSDDPRFKTALHAESERHTISLWSWLKQGKGSIVLGLVLAVVVTAVWVVTLAAATWIFGELSWMKSLNAAIGSAGAVFGLALAALILGPKALESAFTKVITPAPAGDDQFAGRFEELIDEAKDGKSDRLIIFVDELDRCGPDDVVATLIDLKTFLDQPHCVFIVAADRDVIERSIREAPQAKPVRGDEPYYATPGAFLDKIFQHQISLPPLRARTLTQFAYSLVQDSPGIWNELRNHGPELYETVVFALVPIHVSSPRRVKVLLNNFATNARICESRGIPWINRATEIAVMTVIQTEFSEVAKDLQRIPKLLSLLRGEQENIPVQYEEVITRYDGPYENARTIEAQTDESTSAGALTAAGSLLIDKAEDEQIPEARRKLNQHLALYLSKIEAADVPDPKPDLFYLQTAGKDEGLSDPALGNIIDLASDMAPADIVAAFEGHSTQTLVAAIPLLIAQADQTFGPGRQLVIQAACRLIERIDFADARSLTRSVGPTVIAARKSPRWNPQCIPGALTLAVASNAHEVSLDLFKRIPDDQTADEILGRIGKVIPEAEESLVDAVHSKVKVRYSLNPQPLQLLLSTLALPDARTLWQSIGEDIIDLIVVAGADDSEESGEAPERSSFYDLLQAARSRPDGAHLLSEIFWTAQGSDSAWLDIQVRRFAANVFSDIGTPNIAVRHSVYGLAEAAVAHRAFWVDQLNKSKQELLSVNKERDAYTSEIAVDFIAGVLLPELSEVASRDDGESIVEIVRHLTELIQPGSASTLLEAAEELFAQESMVNVTWEDDQYTRWHWRHSQAHQIVRLLTPHVPVESANELISEDVCHIIMESDLGNSSKIETLGHIDSLDYDTCRLLASKLDEIDAEGNSESAVLMLLRIRARLRSNGRALPSSILSFLDDSELSCEVVRDWLKLRPSMSSFLKLVPQISPQIGPMRAYSQGLTVQERTDLWIALENNAIWHRVLAAIGELGVRATIITHVAPQLENATNFEQREIIVLKIIDAKYISQDSDIENGIVRSNKEQQVARRAGGSIALQLLKLNQVGDARLAAKLVIRLNGASRSQEAALRQAFNDAANNTKGAFSRQTASELRDLKLLDSKSLIELIMPKKKDSA